MPETRDPCAAWDEDLSALIDGELAAPRARELRAHLEGCTRCSARLGELRRVDDLLATTPLPEVPESLRMATLERIVPRRTSPDLETLEGPGHRSRRAPPPRERRRPRAPAIAAASAAAAALALYLLLRPVPEVVPVAPPEPPIAERPAPPAPPGPETPSSGPPPIQIVEPLPPPPLPPPPDPEIPAFVPELTPPGDLIVDLEAEPPEELAVVLLGVEREEDFDVIAHLEILERLLALDEERG